MRAPLFFLLFFYLVNSQNCQNNGNNGKYCSDILSSSLLRFSSLEYKCQFPIFIVKSDILKLDPTVHITMKIGEYCPKTCCSTTTSSSTSSSTTTSTSTSTTPTPPTTTSYKSPLQKFNDVMNEDGAFKSLMDHINFNSTATEGLERFRKYTSVKKEVDEHNINYTLGLSSYKMATNSFSVALKGEVAPLTLSLDALTPTSLPAISSNVNVQRKKRQTDATVDWRPFMKPILNQLTCGGCWAFSMIAMIEGFFAIHGYNTSSLSVQQLLTCDTAKDLSYGLANIGCKGGYFQIAGNYLEVKGARDASNIPFDMDDSSCDSPFFPPAVPRLLNFDDGFISGNFTTAQLISMEQSIEEKVRRGPVAVGMAAGDDIYKYAEGVYDGECGSKINHAVVIVGFTDDYWIIRNSWGATWGEDGYFRVKRVAGKDPCRLYSYWSQATAVGSNETYAPPAAGGGKFVIQSSTPPLESSENSGDVKECGGCEEECGCDDEDDDDDYEEEDGDEETTSSTSSSSSTSTTDSTTTSSTTPSSTTSSSTTSPTTSSTPKTSTTLRSARTTTRRTTTTPRRTTTPPKSIFDRWADNWNNFWG